MKEQSVCSVSVIMAVLKTFHYNSLLKGICAFNQFKIKINFSMSHSIKKIVSFSFIKSSKDVIILGQVRSQKRLEVLSRQVRGYRTQSEARGSG